MIQRSLKFGIAMMAMMMFVLMAGFGCQAETKHSETKLAETKQEENNLSAVEILEKLQEENNLSAAEMLEKFQEDADIIRLRHLEYYGNLLLEYHDKTGKYPFIGVNDVPAYVHIATPMQKKSIVGQPPYRHVTADFSHLVKELGRVLERDIEEYYDPQEVMTDRPNFYLYMVDGDGYYFAVHTHQSFSFANQVAPNYNKVEITNQKGDIAYLHNPRDLFKNEAFRAAVTKEPSRPKFFEYRANKFICATRC